MSATINGSDIQTLLNATQGLGFVEGNAELLHVWLCSLLCLCQQLLIIAYIAKYFTLAILLLFCLNTIHISICSLILQCPQAQLRRPSSPVFSVFCGC